ncbi:MAG: electron transfer flavoprotein subunit beta/FixA family protein [Proteobacteria bacterium]|nr:electron transfer flavoprotein subunit beta/FixA family protein [Pseudomonadota bacterium]MDE3207405.1 electron transfer flavoprotein subunit beta/FixA family protein [Pseudomonadota bacterium]
MKALVAVKRALDYNIVPRIRSDGTDVDIAGAKMSISPLDEIALEEALRLKEQNKVDEILVVSVGPAITQDVLRHGLAMGASRALLLEAESLLDQLGIAKLLHALVEREKPDLILLGKQSIDDEACQVGQMLAGLMNASQGTFASKLQLVNDEIIVTRETEAGTETLALMLPAVITADLRLNEPRFVKLPNLMMAKKKPIEIIPANELVTHLEPRIKRTQISPPATRPPGILVKDVADLVTTLNKSGALHS